MNVGLRVVRGKTRKFGSQDGGEERVGTVVGVERSGVTGSPRGTVVVLWDGGVRENFPVGQHGYNDLRVLDGGPAGTLHGDIQCDFCLVSNIQGIRWKCSQCYNFDLCHVCYHESAHDLTHAFYRIDTKSSQKILVPARNKSKKVQAKGTFIGARVIRGDDWLYDDQDGGWENTRGAHKEGTVLEVTNIKDNSCRSCVKIKWDAGGTNYYRRGHEGKVEVKCTRESNGEAYYVKHLPKLGDYAFNAITKEDWVKLDENELSPGDKQKMITHLGQIGRVLSLTGHSARVQFNTSSSFRIPLVFLLKVRRFRRGDTVKITKSLEDARKWQAGHGVWNEAMAGVLGKEGKVVTVDDEGDVLVLVDNEKWLFNPLSCTLVKESECDDPKQTIDVNDCSPAENGRKETRSASTAANATPTTAPQPTKSTPASPRSAVPESTSSDGDSVNCSKCKKQPFNVTFLPCKHCCCNECAEGLKKCHVCSKKIDLPLKMF